MEYYQAVAPVIAIIFLALALEARSVDRIDADSSGGTSLYSAVTTSILLVLLVIGELVALFSLAEGKGSDLALAVTAIAVVCGGGASLRRCGGASGRPLVAPIAGHGWTS